MNHRGEAAERGTSDFIYKANKSLRRETARVSSGGRPPAEIEEEKEGEGKEEKEEGTGEDLRASAESED